MTSVAILLVALGVLWFMLAGWKTGSLTVLERYYLLLSPLPSLLALGAPAGFTMLGLGTDAARLWSNRLSVVGIGLSVALVLAGLALLWRRRLREAEPDGRLAAGIFLAGIPAFLTLAVVVLYSL